MKLVSAVITTHNRLQLLKRAVDSVRAQTYPDIEIIVVDDASNDGTREYCQSVIDIRYIYILSKNSRGGNYARNLGIKAAQGEYIAFLDDDDAWLPEKIEKQVKLMEKMDCELVFCGRKIEELHVGGMSYIDVLPSKVNQGDMKKKILLSICTTTSAILCRKDALYDVGLFDENLKFWQEYELTIRLAQRKPFYFIDEPLVIYRVNPKDKNRLTNKFFEWMKAVDYIHEKHRVLYSKLDLIERFKVKGLVYCDGAIRLNSCGFQWKSRKYKLIGRLFSLPHFIVRKLHGIGFC